jgi:hypothetical protein
MVEAHHGPCVYSATSRNEYQKLGRRVRLKTNCHLWADVLENVGSSTSHNLIGFHGLLQGLLYLTLIVRVRVRVTLQLTVSRSVCLGVEPNLGLLTRYIIFFLKVAVLSYLGRPL